MAAATWLFQQTAGQFLGVAVLRCNCSQLVTKSWLTHGTFGMASATPLGFGSNCRMKQTKQINGAITIEHQETWRKKGEEIISLGLFKEIHYVMKCGEGILQLSSGGEGLPLSCAIPGQG